MRLFTALDISGEVRANLVDLLRKLKPAAKWNWSPPENLHITTKFIGEWEEDEYTTICDALDTVAKPGAMEISLRGLGWFPNPHNPRVFFAGIVAPPTLVELARATDAACAAAGVPSEQKKFQPHLTLARIKHDDGLEEVRRMVAELGSVDFGTFTAKSFYLYESEMGAGGSKYKKLEEFPLL